MTLRAEHILVGPILIICVITWETLALPLVGLLRSYFWSWRHLSFLGRAAVDGVNIGPFEISDLSLILKALPVVVSYLFYDILNIAVRGGEVSGVYRRILQLLHPAVAKSDLLILIAPHRSR